MPFLEVSSANTASKNFSHSFRPLLPQTDSHYGRTFVPGFASEEISRGLNWDLAPGG